MAKNKDLVKEVSNQIVHTCSIFSKDDSFDDPRFMKIRCAIMHSGTNLNKSRFSKEVIEEAKDSFKNIPILADVVEYKDKDGESYLDYSGHTMHIEKDKFNEEEDRLIYDERVVGIIPETNNFELVFDEETQNYYAYSDALLYRAYGNYVCDILESRGNKTDVSVEVLCDDVSFSTDEGVLDVGKMTASGVCLLGEVVNPGMKKAHAVAFSLNKESRDNQLLKIMQELKQSLDNYINAKDKSFEENSEKGGNNHLKFEELLEKYGKTAEDIDFEYSEMSDEELEAKFEELFKEKENFEDGNDDGAEAEDPEEGEAEEPEAIEDENEKKLFEDMTRTYSVSHEDIKNALYVLVSAYEEANNEYLWITKVYDNHFVAQKGCGGYIACKYSVKEDNSVALDGDFYEVFAEFLTKEERDILETMRSNYSSISEELKVYKLAEENCKKDALFELDEYASISDNKEFIKLRDNHSEFALNELTAKLDEIQLKVAKSMKFSRTVEPKKKDKNDILFPFEEKKTVSFLDSLLNK